jgi:uncharacterized protein YegP (UPF0339 family)
MAASNLEFLIIRDVKDGYRWRLRSAVGETVDFSGRGLQNKSACEQEVQRLRTDKYSGAQVRDLTASRAKN